MDKRRYKIGDLIDNKYGPELEILGIDDDSGKTDSCYKTTCTKCGYIIERTSDFLEKMKICPGCEEKPPAVKTDDDGMSTVQQNSESHKDKTDPKEKADLHGEGGDAMQIIESGSNKIEKLPGAVDKHTPDNKTSGHNSNTNLKENSIMDLNLKKLALPQDFQNMPGAKKLWTNIPIRKPNKTEFFRVSDDENYTIQAAIIELKEESEIYLIDPELLVDLSEFIVPAQVVVAVTRMGALMIWPVKLPQERRCAWHDTALHASELAKKKWICMRSNMSAGCYELSEATAKLPEPEFPTEELTFERMLELAFRDFYVDSLDHPLVLRLTGQV